MLFEVDSEPELDWNSPHECVIKSMKIDSRNVRRIELRQIEITHINQNQLFMSFHCFDVTRATDSVSIWLVINAFYRVIFGLKRLLFSHQRWRQPNAFHFSQTLWVYCGFKWSFESLLLSKQHRDCVSQKHFILWLNGKFAQRKFFYDSLTPLSLSHTGIN